MSDIEFERVTPLYTAKTLAERLACSERYAWELMRPGGAIPSFKLGGARKAHPDDVERYIDEQRSAA